MITVRQDQIICEAGSANNAFYIIAEGGIAAMFGNRYIPLGKGDVVGIFGITCDTYTCTYQAETDSVLIPYQFKDAQALLSIMAEKADVRRLLLNSMNAHICDFFKIYADNLNIIQDLHNYVLSARSRYQTMCKIMHFTPKTLPFSEDLDEISTENKMDFWMPGYYEDTRRVMNSLGNTTSVSATFTYGYLDKCCHDLAKVVSLINDMEETRASLAYFLLNDEYIDFYDLYSDLFLRSQANGDDTSAITSLLTAMADRVKALGYVSSKVIEARAVKLQSTTVANTSAAQGDVDSAIIQAKLVNSIGEILEFSGTSAENASEFKKAIEEFKALPDRDSTEPDASRTRKKVAMYFGAVYNDTVLAALAAKEIPTIIKMFINFGYVDMELCGRDNAFSLYKIAESYRGHREQGIYTILEWFTAIYKGQKSPSRNEFEVDFSQYVRTLVREGKIDKNSENEMLNNPKEKVMYELNNMFSSVNKVTTGRVFTFCPVLQDSTMIRSLDELLLTPGKILDTLDKINAVDYSAFYHEYIFEDTKAGVKEIVKCDIRPNFILMPNVGTHGIMWQEIEGLNRRTPARMFLSALFQDNLDKAMMRMIAEYRWEMCKREMGARWNDVTAHSLTGDYCDYAQFFSKNRDLTADAKEKLKNNLKRCKNSFKELFIFDYALFITYEAVGSCRLNKIVRSILFRYCPLSAECRNVLQNNNVFEECLSKHKISVGQTLHRLDIIEKRYTSNGKPVPEELAMQKKMLEK